MDQAYSGGLLVIKVGGSLLDWPELPGRLLTWLDSRRGVSGGSSRDCVFIAGGGPVADVIRALDRGHTLGDDQAHRLAIQAMELTSQVLAAILPGSQVVHRPEELESCWNLGRLAILAPRRFIEEIDDRGRSPLPASWDVTSDSIAARIAVYLGARRLVLLKSRSVATGASRREAAAMGVVDPMFPAISGDLSLVEVVCLRGDDLSSTVLGP